MFDWLIRNYENGVRRLFKQRGGIIENENGAPGIIEAATTDTISQIFSGDVARLEAEHASRGMQRRFTFGGAISFNKPRRQ